MNPSPAPPPSPEASADAPIESQALSVLKNPGARIEACVRKHPGSTLLAAAGLGVVMVLIARALTPPPPKNRAVRLLEDIQQRLAGLADDGAHAMSQGMDNLGELHLDRKFNKLVRGLKNLVH